MLTTFVFTELGVELPSGFDLYNFFYDNLHISTIEQERVVGDAALKLLSGYLDTTLPNNTIPVSELYLALLNKIEPEINKYIKELCKVKDKGLEKQYYIMTNLVNKWLYGDNVFFYFYIKNFSFGDTAYNIAVNILKFAVETTELQLRGVIYLKEV